MEIKNRLFPYPVLCVENDDYENCSFDVNTKVKEDINDIYFGLKKMLDDADMRRGYALKAQQRSGMFSVEKVLSEIDSVL